MQRLIRSFNTLTDELREKLQEQFPDGIDNSHIRAISTAKGETLRVIELRTAEAIYLIKINPESRAEIEEFLDQEEATPAAGDDMDGEDLATGDDGASDEEEEEDKDDAPDDDEDDDADADKDAGDEDDED
ncbi:MAG: DNA primase [Flavobacteriales bacterium]|nr:DNA primase [Flavobacteriales bacterium]MBP6698980.1 DNA primase [Flavobacteriales bacterium]